MPVESIGMGFALMIASAFIPGFFLSLGLFPPRTLSKGQRVGYSFFFSIAFVPLSLYALNKLAGVPIESFTVLGVMALLSMAGLAVLGARLHVQKKRLQ